MVERCWGREKRKSTVVEKKRKFSLGEVCRVAWRWRTCPVLWWWRCCSAVKGAVHEGASGARVTVRCAGGRSPQAGTPDKDRGRGPRVGDVGSAARVVAGRRTWAAQPPPPRRHRRSLSRRRAAYVSSSSETKSACPQSQACLDRYVQALL